MTNESGESGIVKRVRFEMLSKRKNGWLIDNMSPLMRVGRANFDMRLTIDIGKVIGYMNKYVTKLEAAMTKGARNMVEDILAVTECSQDLD